MKEEPQLHCPASPPDPNVPPELIFQHPNEVLLDTDLTRAEQRAILASWACDLRAAESGPGSRRLKKGACICLLDVLKALQALDERSPVVIDQGSETRRDNLSGVNAPRGGSAIFASK